MAKAVIFDVDGTLVDSVDQHAQAWVDAFGHFGHEVGFDAVRGQIGKGGDQLMPAFLSREQIEEEGSALETYRGEILKDRYLSAITAFPSVPELFRQLLAGGKQVALASSAKKDELATYKKIAGIEQLVAVETSSDDAEHSKPDPDIFQAAMARLPGVAAADVVVVGDTPYDAEAAGKAGLRTVGVTCGGWPREALLAAGCSAVFAGPADLLAHLDEWC